MSDDLYTFYLSEKYHSNHCLHQSTFHLNLTHPDENISSLTSSPHLNYSNQGGSPILLCCLKILHLFLHLLKHCRTPDYT